MKDRFGNLALGRPVRMTEGEYREQFLAQAAEGRSQGVHRPLRAMEDRREDLGGLRYGRALA